VLPSDVAWEVILSVAAASLVLIVLLAAYAALQLVRRRPVRVWVVRGFLIALGLFLGFLVLATNGTETPRLLTLLASAIVIVLVFVTRPRTGGAVLVAIAVPWTMWWASFLADNALWGRHWAVSEVVAALIPGVAVILAGTFSFFKGGTAEAARHPSRIGEAVDRKFGVTALTLIGPKILGMATYELACAVVLLGGGVVTVTLLRGRPVFEAALIAVVGILVTWAATCAVWVLARRPSDRRAWEGHSWLGEWELDRYRDLVGGPALPTRQDFRKWLKASPDRPELAWIRSELFALEGQYDEARMAAMSIPDDTPYGRVERESALAVVDWHSGGSGDTAALRAAAEAVLPVASDERLRADVALAAAEVRRLIGIRDPDPVRPMRDARDRLGARADGILWSVVRRRLLSQLLLLAVLIVGIVVVLDQVVQLG
jgi:hypothetical protein